MMKLFMLAVLAALSVNAQAGEVLRFKNRGDVRTTSLAAATASLDGHGLFLVQWKDRVHNDEKAQVAALGLELLGYFPDDAFLAKGNAEAAKAAARLGFVRVVLPVRAGDKIEKDFQAGNAVAALASVPVTVQLAPGADLAAIAESFESVTPVGDNLVVGTAKIARLWVLATRDDVLWIERYLPLRSFDLKPNEIGAQGSPAASTPTRTGYESGTKIVNVDSFYARGMTGQGQVVAVADTGLDTGDATTISADFQGNFKTGLAMGLGGHSWGDPMMHGTHVSGSILGNGRNSGDLIRGGAYGAQLVMLGMWSDIMNNIMPPSVDKLYQAGYDNGARIQSNSWGAPNSAGRYDAWAALTDQWLFNHPDYLILFASGNDGADLDHNGVIDENTVSSPGSSKNVLTVGASQNLLAEGGIQKQMKDLRNGGDKWGVEPIASSKLSQNQNGMAAFSSRGPTADGRLKPEIVAPGTNIVSVRDKHPKADPSTMSWGVYDDNYVYMGGTSMATPVAAGAAALVRQHLVQQLGSSTVSAALVKAAMANAADDLYPGQFGLRNAGQEQPTVRPNNHEGWGRVNVANFLGSRTYQFLDEATGLATGQEKTVRVQHSGGALRVTLAYTDAPGVSGAAKTLVNDLDLTVTDTSGRTVFPNNGASKDSTNNMEQVDLGAAPAGSYVVRVNAASVPQGRNGAQPYALVISSGN